MAAELVGRDEELELVVGALADLPAGVIVEATVQVALPGRSLTAVLDGSFNFSTGQHGPQRRRRERLACGRSST
jgi:hypothetical protein